MYQAKVRSFPSRIFILSAALFLATTVWLSAFAGAQTNAEQTNPEQTEPKTTSETRPTAQTTGAETSGGTVFAMTNDKGGNEVLVYRRGADGRLNQKGSAPTGGRGSGVFENSNNGLILADRERESSPNNLNGGSRFLFATNAGSDTVTSFRVGREGRLTRVDVQPSRGDNPISVTASRGRLYVLNGGVTNCTGGSPTIAGFTVGREGELTAIPDSERPVSGGSFSGCAQVSFDPSGDVLVVTERTADVIDTYTVDGRGRPSRPIVNETTGFGPFGFTFTRDGELLTTENFGAVPGLGGVAPYRIGKDGRLTPLTDKTVRNGRTDTCWMVLTDDGRYAYVTNFGSGDISSYRVDPDGELRLLDATAARVGHGASDEALSDDSRYLYARNSLAGTLRVFRVEDDGSLRSLQTVRAPLPGGAGIGLAAR